MSAARITRIGTTRDQLGESPVWDERRKRFYWIDALAGSIQRLDPATGAVDMFSAPAPIGSLALQGDGGAVLALRDGFAHYDFDTRVLTEGASIGLDHPKVRLNDGKADPYGRFVAGTMHSDRAPDEMPQGGLYRLDTSGAVELLETDLAVSNGPCFSPDGRSFYLADSARRIIWAYDYSQDGPLANKRAFVDTETQQSGCDGATIDQQGYLWSVLVRIGKIARFAPDGTIERIIDMPIRHPTSITFGGPELEILYVTSISRSHALRDDHPDAGGLFAVEGLGVRGLPAHRFAPG
ncbi:SMP-30/gluconolactonase/LRE family protein [Bradyrhizobium sp. GCM10027634]|uniref:SMP-30/gluconolactonase/LRE family protein n=1 Tax=unclassified Bradyrhizobium TaxID=2631580 RepID=UPI00263AA673|nr:SMP-30/gluconolactonase/LRE family protein [Bradyrhizobium sp. WYCCWR 12677]MDN5004318.1 SMP-30/gluconolactonase/LRE family protein [Bradyrhizobium sp. WYCCWR 12677]